MHSRSTVIARKGIVASSHELASFWGAEVLRSGGNVVDAAITTSSILCVVQNNQCGLGGDLFALVKCGESRVRGVNGSGRAGNRATIEFYEKSGENIPKYGPLAALTVPGIVHAWGEMARKYGTMEMRDLLKPAIDYAESGFALTKKYVESIRSTLDFLHEFGEWSRIFAPGGIVPTVGSTFKQKELASSLKSIADEGTLSFYSGSLMEKIVSGIRNAGGILEKEDFVNHFTTWDEPIKTNYRGVDVYETAPNSQAATVILWLNMLENFDLSSKRYDSKSLMKLFLETGLRAYSERAKRIADPSFHKLPLDFESKGYASKVLSSTLENRESAYSKVPDGDTTYFSVADRDGNCASVIQSNYMSFGSGLVPKGTGLVLHNRGCYFSLDRTHHNSLLPGKRTFHTICASLGEKDHDTLFALGLMGGDIQPQVHVQLMTKILDFKKDIQEAIDDPRWVFPATIYENPQTLLIEEDLESSLEGSRFGGLHTQILQGVSAQTGHAQGIWLYGEGNLGGGADPRGDGAAVGF